MTVNIFELKKKLVSTIKIDLKAIGLTNKPTEENIEIKSSSNPPISIGSLPVPRFFVHQEIALILVIINF